MSIINSYILRQFLLVFGLAMGVLGFMFLVGTFVKLMRDMDFSMGLGSFVSLILLLLPKILSYVMPVALLVAVSLVFTRLSAENEISALRSGGVSVWQIVAAPILLAAGLSALCLYLNTMVIPQAEYAKRMFIERQVFENPEMVMQPQRAISMGNQSIFIEGKDEKNGDLLGVTLTEFDHHSDLVKLQLYAKKARISDKQGGSFRVDFYDVMIIQSDAGSQNPDKNQKEGEKEEESGEEKNLPLRVSFLPNERTSYRMSFEEEDERMVRKGKYLIMPQLIARIKALSTKDEISKGDLKEKSKLSFFLNKSMAMAFAPLSFLLLALPFGFTSQRRQTSAGLVISLVIMVGYFGCVLLAGSLRSESSLRPDILVWVPNIVYQLSGIFLLVFKVRA